MRRALSGVPIPRTEDRLIDLIEATFGNLTGTRLPYEDPISDADAIFVIRYARGGMSSGHIFLRFWRCSALPLLRSRYNTIRQPACALSGMRER